MYHGGIRIFTFLYPSPFQYDKAKAEKEKIELNALKLNRDLEKVQTELNELRELRGMEDVRGAKEKQESDRMVAELEELHEKFDKSQLQVKNLTEEKERFEVEARKYRNQVMTCTFFVIFVPQRRMPPPLHT
jgi:hypothetical protein